MLQSEELRVKAQHYSRVADTVKRPEDRARLCEEAAMLEQRADEIDASAADDRPS